MKEIENKSQQEIEILYNKILERKKNYWIIDFVPHEKQQLLIDAISKLHNVEGNLLPVYTWLLFQWGNWAWKTAIALYIAVLFALWNLTKEYNLPYIGSKKKIFIWTESGENLKNSIMPYLTWEFSNIRIPPEAIKKINQDNWIVKRITLHNWCIINFFTYDQGRKRIQGTNGDLYLLDEEPVDTAIFTEALARTRNKWVQMLLSFTPLSGYTASYEYFYEQESEKIRERSYVQLVNSNDNHHADHTWADWLTPQERKMRLEWLFTPPSGLVYPNFNRDKHTLPYFDPKELGNVRFYAGLDFWVSHPMAFTPIAVDEDENLYIFDLIYESELLIKDLAKKIREMEAKYWIEFEYIIADSAGKRERTELKNYWIDTVAADKWSKGENWDSNRRAWIMKVNQLLHDGKIYIADHLKEAIKEFENHHYKDWWKKDWQVEKIQDDFLRTFPVFNEMGNKNWIVYAISYFHIDLLSMWLKENWNMLKNIKKSTILELINRVEEISLTKLQLVY